MQNDLATTRKQVVIHLARNSASSYTYRLAHMCPHVCDLSLSRNVVARLRFVPIRNPGSASQGWPAQTGETGEDKISRL